MIIKKEKVVEIARSLLNKPDPHNYRGEFFDLLLCYGDDIEYTDLMSKVGMMAHGGKLISKGKFISGLIHKMKAWYSEKKEESSANSGAETLFVCKNRPNCTFSSVPKKLRNDIWSKCDFSESVCVSENKAAKKRCWITICNNRDAIDHSLG